MNGKPGKQGGVDWQGLFKWSTQYSDGTKESKFSPMTKEEREWLENVIKEYTFDEADRMSKIVSVLYEHHTTDKEELLELLEELQELIDIHPRNSLNLDKIGGFKILMDVMFNNEHAAVRRLAMMVFGLVVQNNNEMQETAYRYGGLQLMYQYVKEEDPKNKEQVIGAFSSLIRSSITALKAEFFSEMKGLDWLKQIILDKKVSKRTLKKVYFLLYDLIVKETDKSIDTVLYQENLIKDYILKNQKVIKRMLKTLDYENEDDLHSDHVLREFVLNCLGAIFQYQHGAMTEEIQEYLSSKVDQINS